MKDLLSVIEQNIDKSGFQHIIYSVNDNCTAKYGDPFQFKTCREYQRTIELPFNQTVKLFLHAFLATEIVTLFSRKCVLLSMCFKRNSIV